MNITAINDSGVECHAYMVRARKPPRSGPLYGFKCNPPGSNNAEDAISFDKIEDAAAYLKSHPSWGIRLKPRGRDAGGLFYSEVFIDGKLR